MSRIVNFIFVFVVAFFFVACGGGGGSAPITDNPTTVTLNGIAVDNYISGATVCVDTNKNNDCNDEASSNRTTTASNGTFTFSDVTPTDDMVIIAYDGNDSITGERFPYIIKNLAKNQDSTNHIVLSSLNTLITDYKLETNSTLDVAKNAVVNFLGSSGSGIEVEKVIEDVMNSTNKGSDEFFKSLKIFQMVAAINDANNSIESAKSFKAIAKAIASDSSLRDTNATITVRRDNELVDRNITDDIYTPVFLKNESNVVQSFDPNFPDFNSSFDLFKAYDPKDNNITYSLANNVLDNNLFNINSSSGVLSFKNLPTTITSPVDFDHDGEYDVNVSISNSLTTIIKSVKVEVKNTAIGISRPILDDLNISVADTLTQYSSIQNIHVTSGGETGIIKYESNTTGTSYFDINNSTGTIYVKNTLPTLNQGGSAVVETLSIRAKNSAGWSSYVPVRITIWDVNDLNSTAIITPNLEFSIYENNNSLNHPIVGTVTVLSTGGPSLTVDDFNITSGNSNSWFDINASGVITTSRSFDYDGGTTQYILGVEANNTNGWGIPADIKVNILDVNEKPEVTSLVQDVNVSFGEESNISFTINDGDSPASQTTTINATSSEGNVTLSNVTSTILNSGILSLTLTGIDPGESNITVTMTDNGGTANGGVNTHNFSFKATVRSNGWKIYENRRLANNNIDGHTVPNFDGITYSWNSTKQWYETATTILMPVQILKSAQNAYLAGNFKGIPDGITEGSILDGHYYVNKSEYIWDINKSQTHTSLTKYKNANGVDNNITAKNNYFQHDANHNFFVSMVTLNSDQNINPKPYKYWIDPLFYPATESDNADYNSVNFIDANDTNTTYGTGEVYSSYFNNSTNEINKIDVNNTNESSVSQCSKMYGKGWRIPTAYEMGLTTDYTASISPIGGSSSGFIPAYIGDDINNDGSMIFSSSLHSMVNGYYYIIALEQIDYGNNGLWTLKKVDKATTAGIRCIYQP